MYMCNIENCMLCIDIFMYFLFKVCLLWGFWGWKVKSGVFDVFIYCDDFLDNFIVVDFK